MKYLPWFIIFVLAMSVLLAQAYVHPISQRFPRYADVCGIDSDSDGNVEQSECGEALYELPPGALCKEGTALAVWCVATDKACVNANGVGMWCSCTYVCE